MCHVCYAIASVWADLCWLTILFSCFRTQDQLTEEIGFFTVVTLLWKSENSNFSQ